MKYWGGGMLGYFGVFLGVKCTIGFFILDFLRIAFSGKTKKRVERKKRGQMYCVNLHLQVLSALDRQEEQGLESLVSFSPSEPYIDSCLLSVP